MMIDVQHHRGQPKGSSFLGMIGNAFAKTEGSTAWSPEKVKSVQEQVADQPTTQSNVQQVIDIPSSVTWSPAAQPVAPQTTPLAAVEFQVQQAQQQAIMNENTARNARAIMASRDYQEGGSVGPLEQAVLDRYNELERTGGIRGLLGGEQAHDEGGWTGGDFSSGEGWE